MLERRYLSKDARKTKGEKLCPPRINDRGRSRFKLGGDDTTGLRPALLHSSLRHLNNLGALKGFNSFIAYGLVIYCTKTWYNYSLSWTRKPKIIVVLTQGIVERNLVA